MTANSFPESLVELAEAAMAADYSRLRKVGQMIARELDNSHPETARKLRLALNRKGVPLQASGFMDLVPIDSKSRLPLVEEHHPPSGPVFLEEEAKRTLDAFLLDAENFEFLAAKGVSSRLALMLSGPPGTGKTLLASHVASLLGRKLYVARLDSVISSMLGDTAKNIRSIFDFIAGKNAVLFLDELDAVAKMRDDRHELGELKRVVNTVIQGIDSLDERSVILGATNHAQMLDKAIWRRFPYRIEFGLPGGDLRTELWTHFLNLEESAHANAEMLSHLSEGLSGAHIENIALAARRHSLLSGTEMDYTAIATQAMAEVGEAIPAKLGLAESRRRIAIELVRNHSVHQAEVARFLGVTRQAVSTYIKGKQNGN